MELIKFCFILCSVISVISLIIAVYKLGHINFSHIMFVIAQYDSVISCLKFACSTLALTVIFLFWMIFLNL